MKRREGRSQAAGRERRKEEEENKGSREEEEGFCSDNSHLLSCDS